MELDGARRFGFAIDPAYARVLRLFGVHQDTAWVEVGPSDEEFFDAGVHEVRLVWNEPGKDAYLESLRAMAPRGWTKP